MKKKYIIPTISVNLCYLEHTLLAGSDPTQNSGSEVGGKPNSPDVKEPTIPVAGDNEEVILGSKGFDAWSSWDD